MSEFTTSLVREKIIIILMDEDPESASEPIVIRSNRMYMRLVKNGKVEKLVVRCQNMGDTLRMIGWIMDEHYRRGSLSKRKVDWDGLWSKTVSSYGKKHNAEKNWVAVYIDGEAVYQTNHSPFVDILEQCALTTLDNYDETMKVAETVLEKVGKRAKIEHSANIAATLTDTGKLTRTGIMNRAEGRSYTFTFTTTGGKIRTGRILRCLMAAGAFLEAINVVLFIKSVQEKLENEEIERVSDEAMKYYAALKRRTQLVRIINNFERVYNVNYRPEKLNFFEGL